jgi:hypothetical protein
LLEQPIGHNDRPATWFRMRGSEPRISGRAPDLVPADAGEHSSRVHKPDTDRRSIRAHPAEAQYLQLPPFDYYGIEGTGAPRRILVLAQEPPTTFLSLLWVNAPALLRFVVAVGNLCRQFQLTCAAELQKTHQGGYGGYDRSYVQFGKRTCLGSFLKKHCSRRRRQCCAQPRPSRARHGPWTFIRLPMGRFQRLSLGFQ